MLCARMVGGWVGGEAGAGVSLKPPLGFMTHFTAKFHTRLDANVLYFSSSFCRSTASN